MHWIFGALVFLLALNSLAHGTSQFPSSAMELQLSPALWTTQVHDFCAGYAKDFEKMRGLPKGSFHYADILPKALLSLEALKKAPGKRKKYEFRQELVNALNKRAKQIDSAGFPDLIAWFEATKEQVTSAPPALTADQRNEIAQKFSRIESAAKTLERLKSTYAGNSESDALPEITSQLKRIKTALGILLGIFAFFVSYRFVANLRAQVRS